MTAPRPLLMISASGDWTQFRHDDIRLGGLEQGATQIDGYGRNALPASRAQDADDQSTLLRWQWTGRYFSFR